MDGISLQAQGITYINIINYIIHLGTISYEVNMSILVLVFLYYMMTRQRQSNDAGDYKPIDIEAVIQPRTIREESIEPEVSTGEGAKEPEDYKVKTSGSEQIEDMVKVQKNIELFVYIHGLLEETNHEFGYTQQ